jgi:uncharacterized protein (DUF302 family)
LSAQGTPLGFAPPGDLPHGVNDMTVISSSRTAAEVVSRLLAVIEERGLTLLGRIDHAAGARAAGLELASEEVILFGNAKAGTPLMVSDPRVGIELPLRILVWASDEGTRLGYRDPRALRQAYEVSGHEQRLENMHTLLAELAQVAAL